MAVPEFLSKALTASLLALPLACSSDTPTALPDAQIAADASQSLDLGQSTLDLGTAADAGAQPDAAAVPDSGQMTADAGFAADAMTTPDAGTSSLANPADKGPRMVMRSEETIQAAGESFKIGCFLPEGQDSLPAIVLLHGFQIEGQLYYGTAEHIASFGYIVCVPEYPAGLRPNHVQNADEVRGTIDWLLASSFAGRIDTTKIGVAGHSLGGKIGVLAAKSDSRIKAYLGLDPVDGARFCNAQNCPDGTEMLPLTIPMGILGETIDEMAGRSGQACAPAEENYRTFYTPAASPAVEITLPKANHVSFVDDIMACGFACRFCLPEQADHSDLLKMIRSFSVAFLEVYLKGNSAYQSYIDGSEATRLYISPGDAVVQKK